ncbi:MAG: HU family DNA-binding protein [Anaeroplasmataceae bacterium]|nr:HU family DNA-binding protein [Anaeroplasmataceae bacterium]
MNKPELVNSIAEKLDTTKKQAEELIGALFETIMDSLVKGEKVVITGFGTFEVHERARKTGRNPQTGEEIFIEGSKAPVFKSAKSFKDLVNKG